MRVHVGDLSVEVHRHERRVRSVTTPATARAVDVEVILRDVGEPRRRAGLEDRVEGRDESERARDDLVAGFEVEDLRAATSDGRPVVQAIACLTPVISANRSSKLRDERTLGDVARAEYPEDEAFVVFTEFDRP